MKTNLIKKTLFFAILSIITNAGYAQLLKFSPRNSVITIQGTSNVHDWKSKTDQLLGEVVLAAENKLQALTLEIPVKSIKSGEKLMDSKTYETFNADKHPNIIFKMTEVVSFQRNGNQINVTVNGNLTLAGTSRNVTIRAKGHVNQSGQYIVSGEYSLKMTDYKMKPPTVLLGALKVGDIIHLQFNVILTDQLQAFLN
jgi:polyisoprenoid-binding protein YceI